MKFDLLLEQRKSNKKPKEGDLFVDEQSLQPYSFSTPVESKSVKIKSLLKKQA